jgi:aspartate carbamoyltransferase catalytic subunit
LKQAIADADVILVEPVVQPDYTKARDERGDDVGMTPANYKITRELLSTKAKSDAILLHSLPRMDEIPADVDITRWSRYWQEAFNGVVMRMGLLAAVLGVDGIIEICGMPAAVSCSGWHLSPLYSEQCARLAQASL